MGCDSVKTVSSLTRELKGLFGIKGKTRGNGLPKPERGARVKEVQVVRFRWTQGADGAGYGIARVFKVALRAPLSGVLGWDHCSEHDGPLSVFRNTVTSEPRKPSMRNGNPVAGSWGQLSAHPAG